ncbi:carbohydrate porin [Pedobacter sp. AW31-3R]|uniref:carbohydrate porin n=1 Tax=Pedobacter sp. AW31-3R TaxID=3445781 RepID=UPI003FA11DBD
MKEKKGGAAVCMLVLLILPFLAGAQITIVNKNVSIGTTGRIGLGYSPTLEGHTGRQLNLSGQGSLGSRLEQGDYVDILPAFHFTPVNANKDSTSIVFQARLAFYSTNGTMLGNVNSGSINGTVIGLPEAFVEVRNIVGSKWSMWAGARYMRYDDIHICDYFYFDDHSSEGFGIKYKNTSFSVMFPAAVDTSSSNVSPYSYVNTISGGPALAYRQKEVLIAEQLLTAGKLHTLKLLAEYHHLSAAEKNAFPAYPGDNGWLVGAKLTSELKTTLPGSFNQFALRYGSGIANGGDNGNTWTWNTYGAPNEETNRYNGAYSITAVEHFMLNLSNKFSLNGYGVYTHSRGGASSNEKAEDYYQRSIFNRKTDFVAGCRGITYLKNWFHLITELHYAQRKDGDQPNASMLKFIVAPTLVPTAERSPWARPHIRAIFSVAKYNKYAAENQYSAFLAQAGVKNWGTYIGVRSEWWIF